MSKETDIVLDHQLSEMRDALQELFFDQIKLEFSQIDMDFLNAVADGIGAIDRIRERL